MQKPLFLQGVPLIQSELGFSMCNPRMRSGSGLPGSLEWGLPASGKEAPHR